MNSLDLLDDSVLQDGFDGDMDFNALPDGSLDLDDLPPDMPDTSLMNESSTDQIQGMKRDQSWDDFARCISDDSDGDITITNGERDELQEFLKDVGISSPSRAPSGPEAFDCWGATISPVYEEQAIEPVGNVQELADCMPYPSETTSRGSNSSTPPPEKRRRISPGPFHPVTPPGKPEEVISMPEFMPDLLTKDSPNPMPTITPSKPQRSPPAGKKRKSGQGTHYKHRTTRQFVPFEEMQRLMVQYGPIKTPRKRKNKQEQEDATKGPLKMESVKRKFYKWFADFEVS